MTLHRGPLDLQGEVHRRYNPLTDEWVLVSPHRTQRPWQGQTEPAVKPIELTHDPACYLCPGNVRAGGARNPQYQDTFVFDNDFAALQPRTSDAELNVEHLLKARSEGGSCRVICYSPRHDLSLGQMTTSDIRRVIDTWSDEYVRLGAQSTIDAVTIFENRGAAMGASNPHPHGQIWANETIPDAVLRESSGQGRYLRERDRCLLCDYAALEIRLAQRVVLASRRFVAIVPFWAVWPFETLVLPCEHIASLDELGPSRSDELAEMLKQLATRYDALFDVSFPYTMGVHQRPTDGQPYPQWHLHFHFYPPLLRSAGVRKFMVGYEMLAGAQRDIPAEAAARALQTAGLCQSR